MHFVDDLIPLILDADDHWWPRDLARLALLSTSWLFYARKRLYARPIISSLPAAELLTRSLIANPSLAPLITGICLQPIPTNIPSSPKALRAIRHLLQLDGLRSLTLGGELAADADVYMKSVGNLEHLQELHVDGSLVGHRLTRCAYLEWDELLAYGLPELRKLRLTQIELDIIPSYPYADSKISSLIVEHVHIISGHLSYLLQGAKTLDKLHITTTEAAVSDEEIRLVFAACAVGCLLYDMRKDCNVNQLLLYAPENMGSLHCLHLDGLFVDPVVLLAVAETCLNLVELVVLGRAVRVSVEDWVNFLKLNSMKSLRRLGLPWGTNMPPFRAWPVAEVDAIRKANASREIPLTIW